MNRKDFNFELPEYLIAQTPILNRENSRLMVLDKVTGQIKNDVFKNILDYLEEGDCLVLNDTKVIPARLFGINEFTKNKVEILLLKRLDEENWEILVNPGKRAKVGDVLLFGEGILKGTITDIIDGGNRIIKFSFYGIFEEILDKFGEMPLPPYIHEKLLDKDRYQTVYAKHKGSSAAPTAGLHFTDDLLFEVKRRGVNIALLTLHVGLGTFRPVKVDNILEHKIHTEDYILEKKQADIINNTKQNNKKVIAVGTTSCRTLESCADENGFIKASSGQTGIFIYPGYKFKVVDSLITNFHLPESTLIMLVSALAGRENILNSYKEAIKEEYRFFSFGDAMFIH